MTDLVAVPVDEEAERICSGTAVVHVAWASELLRQLEPDDLYDPQLARLLVHLCDPATVDVEPAPYETALEARIRALSACAHVPEAFVRQLADDYSQIGQRHLAPRRVRLAARRRELMVVGRTLYNDASLMTADQVVALTDRLAQLRDEIAELEAPRLVVLTGGAA